MIKNYILVTLRSLMKNKLYVFINIIGMGIAIACCIVAYFLYETDANFDAVHVKGNSIYRVEALREFQEKITRFGVVPLPLGASVKENISDVDEVARYFFSWSNFKIEDNLFSSRLAYVDPEFFQLFTYEFIAGDPADLKDRSKVFISEEMANRLFGSTDVLGKAITQVYGTNLKELEVGGVFKDQPQNSSFYRRQAFLNYDNYFDEFSDVKEDDWKNASTLFVQIKDDNRVKTVHDQLQQYTANNNKVREDFIIKEFILDPLPGMGHRDRAEDTSTWLRYPPPIAAVIGTTTMGILILLIACFNLTNTAIAISSRRLKEIGIRKVMGGLRRQLIAQFIGETMVMCLAALLLGFLFAEVLLNWWNIMWTNMKLSPHYLDNPQFLIFIVSVLVITGLLAGSYPAFYISKFEPVSILKGKLKFGGTNYFTRTLLGLQYAISLVAIVSAFAFIHNANYQRDYNLGFDIRGAIISYVNDLNEFQTYRNALLQDPDIISIAGAQQSIFSSRDNDPVKYGSKQLEVDIIRVGDDYLKTMGLELVEGRDFVKDSETDKKESIIVTQKMAETFGWDKPIGKEIIWMDTVRLYVVGVVKDVYTYGLWREMEPMMIRYTGPETYSHLIVNTRPGKLKEVNSFMETEWKKIFPNRLYNGRMLNEEQADVAEVNNNIVKMFAFLGIVAMILCSTGLFSLVSLNIIKRMKEIGVRKVLGASILNITHIINLEFFVILCVASLMGSGLSFLLVDSLMDSIWDYYQGTTALTFIISITLLFFISGVTVGYKIFSAASLNPVNTLRNE